MQLSIKTPSGTTRLENKSQSVKLSSPLACLNICLTGKEECILSVNKKTICCNEPVNAHTFDFSQQNTESLQLKSYKNTIHNIDSSIALKVSVSGGRTLESKDIENLMNFRNSLNDLPTDEQDNILLTDLLLAIETNAITLLSVQKPLTGYDNKSLLDQIKSALSQKIRAICSRPKQGTKTEELVQDVSLVKRINSNTLSHLASHTEHWKARTLTGLIPKRLKADIIEDEINIYENLFFKMAIDDLSAYTNQQIRSLESAQAQNKAAIDWETYGNEINDYRRGKLLNILFSGRSSGELQHQNDTYEKALCQWKDVSKMLSSISGSAFYKQIDGKRRFSKTVHLTNILKNDQRYKALYDIWCLIQKPNTNKQTETEGASNDLTNVIDHYYAVYCTIFLLYAMYNLDNITFTEDSYFTFNEFGRIKLNAIAKDAIFTYRITDSVDEFNHFLLKIDIEENVNVETAVPSICRPYITEHIFDEFNGLVSFDADSYQLRFRKKPDSAMQTALHNVLHKLFPNRHRLKKEEQQEYSRLSRAWKNYVDEDIINNHALHDPHCRTLYISPICFAVQSDTDSIKSFTDDLFTASKDVSPNEYICYLLPHMPTHLAEIKSPRMLRHLFNYGEAYYKEDDQKLKNYKKAVLPIAQTDIDSLPRLMKLISLHRAHMTMEMEKENPIHCPLCGSTNIFRIDDHTLRCCSKGCEIEWGETHCTNTDDCGQFFYWIRPSCQLSKENLLPKLINLSEDELKNLSEDELKNLSKLESIPKKDKLFGERIITDFEFETRIDDDYLKPYPVCPKCGTRRF